MRNRNFKMVYTRDARQWEIHEREVFNHFLHETLRRLLRPKQSSSRNTCPFPGLSRVEAVCTGKTSRCHKCGRLKRPMRPRTTADEREVSIILTPPAPTDFSTRFPRLSNEEAIPLLITEPSNSEAQTPSRFDEGDGVDVGFKRTSNIDGEVDREAVSLSTGRDLVYAHYIS